MNEETKYIINNLQGLTDDDRLSAWNEAKTIVTKAIGDKPSRQDYSREYGTIWNILDIPMLVIFIGALLVSLLHIFDYASVVAGVHYEHVEFTTGLRANAWWYVAIQQVSYLLMAEFAMISFFTVWRVNTHNQTWIKRLISLPFWLAIISAGFVLVVNIYGGGGFNPSGILPPLLTIGIGLRLEEIMSTMLTRKNEIEQKYLAAMNDYELATQDPENHQRWRGAYANALKKQIKLVNGRGSGAGSTARIELMNSLNSSAWRVLVMRELRADQWFTDSEPDSDDYPAPTASQRPQRASQDDLDFTPAPASQTAMIYQNGTTNEIQAGNLN